MTKKKNKPADSKPSRPAFHENLEGFDIRVNTFGEMESTFGIDKINEFLDQEVKDKKLVKKGDKKKS
jgi:hypothetical protein